MTLLIWTSAAFSTVYRCGGWAFVRQGPEQLSGSAGGDRHTTADRVALAGLAAALKDLPDAKTPGAVRIFTTSPELMAFAGVLAGLAGGATASGPAADLDLWAPIAAAAKGRRISLSREPLDTASPTAFTTAWADLGRDKAKASGAFVSLIPKANLAKVKGLPEHNA